MLQSSPSLGHELARQATVVVDTSSGRSWERSLRMHCSTAHLCKPGAGILERHAGLILLSRPDRVVKV